MTPYDAFWTCAICGSVVLALVVLDAGRNAIERWRKR